MLIPNALIANQMRNQAKILWAATTDPRLPLKLAGELRTIADALNEQADEVEQLLPWGD